MYGQATPNSYAGNPASSFLYDSMQNNMGGSAYGGAGGGLVGQQFGQVMNSMAGGINQSAQMGIVPGGQPTIPMTPQQVAAQMNVGGPMSVLPMLGGSMIPRVIYPLAGVWSMVDGARSMYAMNKEAKTMINNRYNPSTDSAYERSLRDMHEVSARWAELGPMNDSY